MLELATIRLVVKFVNHQLAREPWARAKLTPFGGRCACFVVPPLSLTVAVTAAGLLERADSAAADVTLRLKLADVPFVLMQPQKAVRAVQLEGDAEFAQALAFVLQNLRPDLAEDLAPWLGDVAAQRLVQLIEQAARHTHDAAQRVLQASADYLVAEQPLLVGQSSLTDFSAALTDTRDAVERLEKRIAQLERSRRA
jgi:ubiquinone biosynthesis protein UbiJ